MPKLPSCMFSCTKVYQIIFAAVIALQSLASQAIEVARLCWHSFVDFLFLLSSLFFFFSFSPFSEQILFSSNQTKIRLISLMSDRLVPTQQRLVRAQQCVSPKVATLSGGVSGVSIASASQSAAAFIVARGVRETTKKRTQTAGP